MTSNLTQALERGGPYVPRDDARSIAESRAAWREYRRSAGYKGDAPLLTPPAGNLKTAKSATPTYGLALAAADGSGDWNVCTWSTELCRAACVLVTAGKGQLPSVRRARAVKTSFLGENPQAFVNVLAWELRRAIAKHGAIAVRLNVASDLRWERIVPSLFDLGGAKFYDYTKAPVGQRDDLGGRYRLTYSVSERPRSSLNAIDALQLLANAAVVFERTPEGLPETWNGFQVIDGDKQDDRTTDPRGTVVGLLAKGAARKTRGTDGGFIKPAIAS